MLHLLRFAFYSCLVSLEEREEKHLFCEIFACNEKKEKRLLGKKREDERQDGLLINEFIPCIINFVTIFQANISCFVVSLFCEQERSRSGVNIRGAIVVSLTHLIERNIPTSIRRTSHTIAKSKAVINRTPIHHP